MKAFIFTLAAFTLMLMPIAAQTEDYEHGGDAENIEEMLKLTQPGEHHELLKKLEGEWNYTMTYKMMKDAPEQTAEGKSINEIVLDGRYLKQTAENPMEMAGQKMVYKGHGYLGYDNVAKEYKTFWIDNMTTQMMVSSGTYDDGTKTLTEMGEHYCPIRNKDISFKSELSFEGDNPVYTMYEKGEDGEYWQMMQIKYSR